MPHIYGRNKTLWIAISRPRHPLFRCALPAMDRQDAERLGRKIDLLLALSKLRDIELPSEIARALDLENIGPGFAPVSLPAGLPSSAPSQPAPIRPRGPVAQAVAGFLGRALAANAPGHVTNKVSMLRQFFGSAVIDPLDPRVPTGPARRRPRAEAFCGAEYLDEITTDDLLAFLNTKGYARATKRHFREIMHGLYEHALVNGLYRSSNDYCPNPADSLPSFAGNENEIIALTSEDFARQKAAVASDPVVHAGCMVMREGGFRLHEACMLQVGDVDFDNGYLRLQPHGPGSSLKTGPRTVTLRVPLEKYLRRWIRQLKGPWLLPSPRGKKIAPNAFAERLRTLSRAQKLPWTAKDLRHSFATDRIAERWDLVSLAREMGNSVTEIEKYYAGAIPSPLAAAWAARPARR